MSRRQVQVCAARMPSDQAAGFIALLQAADDLFLRSVELRLRAWELYRKTTGLTPAGKSLKLAKPPKPRSAGN